MVLWRRRGFLGAGSRAADGPRPAEPVRIGEASFRFPGFTQDAVSTLSARFDFRAGAPSAPAVLTDVLFQPHLRCLYSSDGARIEETKVTYMEPGAPAWFNDRKLLPIEQETMPERIASPARPERVREDVLFLGEVLDHYGHFLTDTLSRMWALEGVGKDVKVLFAPDPKGRLAPPFVREVLGWLGLDDSRILRPRRPTLFDRVLCPTPALQLSRVYDGFDAPHRAIAARALAGRDPKGPDRPVYLTRSGLGPDLRRPGQEEELERRLEREGYLIVQPERLGLREQMALFNGEAPIVGLFGSAMHTVLFRARLAGQKLATLFPAKIPPRFMMVDAVKGSQAAYLNCMVGDPARSAGAERTWTIDPDLAMAQLDAEGFLSRR